MIAQLPVYVTKAREQQSRRVNHKTSYTSKGMCGRIIQASGPLRYQLVDGLDVPDRWLSNIPRRYNCKMAHNFGSDAISMMFAAV